MNALLFAFLLFCHVPSICQTRASLILEETYSSLLMIDSLKFNQCQEISYASEDYYRKTNSDCIYLFSPTDTALGMIYQVHSPDGFEIYNGTSHWECILKSQQMNLTHKPSKSDFSSRTFLYNSLFTIRQMLPVVRQDTSVKVWVTDTIIEDHAYINLHLSMHKKLLSRLGGYHNITLDRQFYYCITIDHETHLPIEILQTNNANKDFVKTTFTELQTNFETPTDESWYHSTFTENFLQENPQEKSQPRLPGHKAPDFKLPIAGTNSTIDSGNLGDTIVLLEFWIRHCGPCIAAIPKLKELRKIYRQQKFKIIGINPLDNIATIEKFQVRYQPPYESLYAAEEIASQYGVLGFPTTVLVKNGQVIYQSSGFDLQTVSDLIRTNLP